MKEKIIYVANDGKEFPNKDQCLAHEAKIKEKHDNLLELIGIHEYYVIAFTDKDKIIGYEPILSGKNMTSNPKFAIKYRNIEEAFKAKDTSAALYGRPKKVVGYDKNKS